MLAHSPTPKYKLNLKNQFEQTKIQRIIFYHPSVTATFKIVDMTDEI